MDQLLPCCREPHSGRELARPMHSDITAAVVPTTQTYSPGWGWLMIRMISDAARAAGLAIAAWGLKQVSASLGFVQRQLPSREPDDRQRKPARHFKEVRKRGSKKSAA